MDANNPVPQPAMSVPPAPPPQPPVELKAPSNGSSNKMIILFVIGIIAIIAIVGGVYFFLNKNQPAAPEPIVAQSPAPLPEENLEGDLNSIDMDTTNNDFTPVDQDLQQL